MNRRTQRGFVLIVVLCLVGLAGMAMALLASGSKTMLFDARRMQYEADRRNLSASGLAWAELNAGTVAAGTPPGGKTLALDALEMQDATLSVSVAAPEGGEPEIRIRTSCRHGRRIISKDSRYPLPPRPSK